MTQPQSESTFIHLLRSVVLLAALIVVPATAVCWNMIPKDFFDNETYEQTTSAPADSNESATETPDVGDSDTPVEAATVPLSFALPQETVTAGNLPSLQNPQNSSNLPIQMVSGTDDTKTGQQIPNSFDEKLAAAQPAAFADVAPKISNEFTAPATLVPAVESYASERSPQQYAQKNFPILESQLKQLGAKYYRLEKWGSRGELFRFSCYVAPSEPYQYQKYFQAIDSDELRVMENVIEEIKRWKKSE